METVGSCNIFFLIHFNLFSHFQRVSNETIEREAILKPHFIYIFSVFMLIQIPI